MENSNTCGHEAQIFRKTARPRNHTGDQSGFTLIEVLIAALILAVGLLTIASAFARGMIILANTPTQLAAKELAYAIIDDIIVQYDAQLFPLTQEICKNEASCEWNGRFFRVGPVVISPNPAADEASPPSVDVTVTVTWSGYGFAAPDASGTGNERSYTTPTATIKQLL